MKKIIVILLFVLAGVYNIYAHTATISSSTNVSCFGACNGSATVTTSGGIGPYSYLWSNSQSIATINNLCPGTYTVTVTDQGDMSTATANVSISQPSLLTISETHVQPTCGQCNGSINVTASGGVAPYSYYWNNGITLTWESNLCPDDYTCTITDAVGCTSMTAVILTNGPIIIMSTVNATCGVCNGSASVSVFGGLPPYSYQWSNGNTTPNIINSCAGTYTLTVTDQNMCTSTSGDNIVATSVVTISNIATTPTTCNQCNGIANPNISGGTAPYMFTWSNGLNTSTANGLCEGNYFLTITDNMGCTDTASFTILNSSGFNVVLDTAINSNCANNSLGSITVHAIGGSGGYTYLWSPGGENIPSISDLTFGYYTVFVTESGGCTDSLQVYLEYNANIYASVINTPANCLDNGTASIINLTGVNPPFTFLWSDNLHQTTATAIALLPGTYYATITDAVGCMIIVSAVINNNCNNIIKGRFYYDYNQNCTQDVGEPGISNIHVRTFPGNDYGYTDINGDYTISTLQMICNVIPTNSNLFGIATCPLSETLSVNFTNVGDTLIGNNFGYYVDLSYFDLSLQPGWTTGHPGFNKSYWILYRNNSLLPQSALIRFIYDPALIFQSCNQSGVHDAINHTIEWTYNNLPEHFNSYWINKLEVLFTVPASISITDSLCSYFEIIPITGDLNPNDNALNICEPITGSYDPNSKDVIPRGQGTPGYITVNDSVLFYTIHFQNTGNDTAFTVVVVDTLSQFVDPGTIVPGASSHPYTFSLTEHGILTFRFDNILLPDSNINEPESNGYFNYTVHLKPNLQIGTVIENKASIFFDFNSAIVTNTTINTIASPLQINEIANNAKVEVYPNPFKNITTFEIKSENSKMPYNLEVFDMLGKKVRAIENINSTTFKFSSDDLESGIYLYKVLSYDKEIGKGKMIVE
ncbi:MAG: T9SS type A sorting domain-containing protein [Bacteroidia bacterium]|nr:T9SS type A sorting domain-containing protein [Bacteroidia bacterium]